MLSLTPQAAEQIRRAAASGDAGGLALRVAARQEADGSLQYGMGFDEVVDSDEALELEGVAVVVAPSSVALLQGTVLDFVEYEPGDFRFIFIPPSPPEPSPGQVAGGCGSGCGCAAPKDDVPAVPVRFFR